MCIQQKFAGETLVVFLEWVVSFSASITSTAPYCKVQRLDSNSEMQRQIKSNLTFHRKTDSVAANLSFIKINKFGGWSALSVAALSLLLSAVIKAELFAVRDFTLTCYIKTFLWKKERGERTKTRQMSFVPTNQANYIVCRMSDRSESRLPVV